MNIIDKKYHANRYVKENLPLLKEVFLEYYGSMWQDLVVDRLNNFAFIGYMTHIQMTDLVCKLKRDISNKYETRYMKENGFDIEKKHLFFFHGFDDFKKNSLNIIMNRQDNFENEVNDLFGLYSFDKDYQTKFSDCLKIIDASKNSLYKYKKAYDEEIKEYQEYIDIDDRYRELFKNAGADYIRHFLNKIYDVLPQEDKDYYDNHESMFYNDLTAAECFKNMLIYKVSMVSILDRIDFTIEGVIESFSKENEEKLHSSLSTSDEKEKIIKYRILYFKKLGLNLGGDYQNYVNNQEAIKLTPKSEDVEKIINAKKEVLDEIIYDFYSTIGFFKENEETLLNSGLICHNTFPYSFKSYNKSHSIVNINLRESTDENDFLNTINYPGIRAKIYPTLLFNTEKSDYFLSHELNHIIETKLADYDIYVDKNGWHVDIFVECGFDFGNDLYKVPKLGKRQYEMFNEVVNDILAEEITDLMHKKGIYIFSEYSATIKEQNNTVYKFAKPLVKDFVGLYKEELKYARLTGIKQKLFKLIGEDNFNELNDLINEFYIYFGCADGDCRRIEETIRNIEEGKVTTDTRKYNDFIELSQVIFEQMKDYKSTKKRRIA